MLCLKTGSRFVEVTDLRFRLVLLISVKVPILWGEDPLSIELTESELEMRYGAIAV